ncbi:MAG: phage portal protein [Phycisphaerae bacterium]|jgi:HK97 family phage portal protein
MSILDRWLDKRIQDLGYAKGQPSGGAPVVVLGGSSASSLLGDDTMPSASTERQALVCSWVFSDVQFLVNEASQSSFYVEENKQEVEDHPMTSLLKWPNQDMGSSYLWQYLFGWLLLRGEAYWWLLPNQAGDLTELWPIPSDSMAPIPDPERKSGHYIRAYGYTLPTTGRTIEIPPEHVCYFRRPNLFDLYRGQGLANTFKLAMETDRSAAQWNRDAYKNEMTVRTGVFLPKEMPDPIYNTAREEIRQALVEEHARYIISRTGQVDIKQFGVSPKDAEYLNSRVFNREEIDRIFGIPAGLWAKEATRANSDAAKAVAIDVQVWPLLCLIADEITAQILRRYYEPGQLGVFRDIRILDRAQILAERTKYWEVQAVNECRADIGKEPFEGTLYDEVPLAILQTAFAAQVATLAQEAAQVPAGEATMAAARVDLKRWRSLALRLVRQGKAPTAREFTSERIPGATMEILRAALEDAGSEEAVKHVFARFISADNAAAEAAKAKEPERAAEEALRKKIEVILKARMARVTKDPAHYEAALEGLDAELQAALIPELAKAVRDQIAAQSLEVGVAFDIAAINQAAVEWAKKYTFELVKGLTETTLKQLRTVISTYLETPGMTQGDLVGMLEPTFGAARANSIATNEVTRAMSQGTTMHQELLAEAGVQMEEVWHTANDDHVCYICGPANGKGQDEPITAADEAPWGRSFWRGRSWKEVFPGGPPGHAGPCRCSKTLRVKKVKRNSP